MSTTTPRSEAGDERSPLAAGAQTARPAPHIRLEPTKPSADHSDASGAPDRPVRTRASEAGLSSTDLLATVSHELRQPLASIRGLTEMLLGHSADFSEHVKTEMLTQVLHDAERVGRLINELLDVGRLESRQLKLRRVETDLGSIVSRAVSSMELSFPDVKTTVDLPAGPADGNGRPIQGRADPVQCIGKFLPARFSWRHSRCGSPHVARACWPGRDLGR